MNSLKGMNGKPKLLESVHQGRNMGLPQGRESYGDGVPIVVVGVTPHQGKRESRLQGQVEQEIG
jgi:hypothetical protein